MTAPLQVDITAPTWKVYERKLAKFPEQYKKAVTRATAQATVIHQRSLKRVTPTRTGKLRRGWVIVQNKTTQGVIANRVPYAPFVEFGTSPHVIYPRKRKFLRFKVGGKTIFARKVNHPGTKAQRMTVNAWRLDARRISAIYKKEFEREINKL